ncbi:MAG: (2E,6E)-farnesyl diphosphate synthase [Oleiphilaceae bacterium]|nr:(2E,6E)-farnesyl diphosphate synthase [Oleiphilaceae bacterium]
MKPSPIETFTAWLPQLRAQVDERLKLLIEQHSPSEQRLSKAIAYSTLLGGKRVRPALLIATAHCFGASTEQAINPACAVELLHAYSLVHDDLPAMDDDDLRRGQATCHKAFDEATAILAGDAMQTMAFEILSTPSDQLNAAHQLEMIRHLASASGACGMVLGQAMDLEGEGKQLTLQQLELVHRHKTGALIEASVLIGSLCGNTRPSEAQTQQLRRYAQCIGLAFQVQDDILDVIGDTETLGKAQGADIARGKSTYPALLGIDGARQKLIELHDQALASLAQLPGGETQMLAEIADFIISRIR